VTSASPSEKRCEQRMSRSRGDGEVVTSAAPSEKRCEALISRCNQAGLW